MKLVNLLFAVCLPIFSNCKHVTKTDEHLNFNNLTQNTILIPSDIKSVNREHTSTIPVQNTMQIEYIKLETNNNCLVDRDIVGITPEHIFIRQEQYIYTFSRTGKFIQQIGVPGHGPGEYNRIWEVAFNDHTKEAYIVDNKLKYIFIYDYENNFIKKIPFDWRNDIINDIRVIDDTTLLISRSEEMMNYHNYSQFQLFSLNTGKVINLSNKYKIPCSTIGMAIIEGHGKIGNSNDGYLLFGYSTDTIFCYNKEKGMFPKYILHPGTKGGNKEKELFILNAHENEKYLFINYRGRDITSSTTFYFDKKTGEVAQYMYSDQNIAYNGNQSVKFHLRPSNIQNFYFTSYGALNLHNLYKENRLSGELKKIAQTLKEDDNPVIVLATLKD